MTKSYDKNLDTNKNFIKSKATTQNVTERFRYTKSADLLHTVKSTIRRIFISEHLYDCF